MNYTEIAQKNQILKVRVGSHLFGTDTPESDTDYEGIFMPSKEMVFGFGICREADLGLVCKDEMGRNTKEAIDYKIREYRDFCRLALQNNPNILNMLFANNDNVIFENNFGKALRAKKHLFPHRGCVERFLGYAKSQLHKMNIKPDNYSSLQIAEELLAIQDPKEILVNVVQVLDLDEKDSYGGFRSPFNDLGPGKHIQVGDIFLERGIKVSRALSTIRERLSRASARTELWEKFGFDTKFGSNLIQILLEGIELVETGGLTFPLKEANLILDIKKGKYTREEVVEKGEDLVARIDLIKDSPLPAKPRRKEVEAFVISEMERWFNV